jgi:alanyl-tRNA synthetase
VRGIKLLVRRVEVGDPKALREAADVLRNRLGTGVVVLGAPNEGKAMLLVAVTRDLQERVHAGKLVGELARHVGGKGGGRADLAQAGGPEVAGLEAALAAAEEVLSRALG